MKKSKLVAWGLGSLVATSILTGGVLATAPPNLEATLNAQRKLVDSRPNDAVAYNDLGNLLEESGDLTAAEEAYQKAITLDPRSVPAHFNLALLYQQQEKDRKAIATLEDLLEIDPNHAWAHYQMGVSLERKGRRGAAVEQYAQAFALDTGLSFPRNNPQILDSRVATEGLLRAEAYLDSQANKVPRQFSDAARIRKMMLSEPAAAHEATPAAEAAAQAAPVPEEGSQAHPAVAGATTGGGTGGGASAAAGATPRVITNEDLRGNGSSGAATGSAGSRARSRTTTTPRPNSTFATPSAAPSYTQVPDSPPVSKVPTTVPTRPSDTGVLPPVGVYVPPPSGQQPAAGQPGATPTAPDRFRPSRRSTASLGWELEPSAPAAG